MNDKIAGYIKEELKRAEEKFNPLNSTHEAYGVILEEVNETKEQWESILSYMHMLEKRLPHDKSESIFVYSKIAFHASEVMHEVGQVAAMARRALKDLYGADES